MPKRKKSDNSPVKSEESNQNKVLKSVLIGFGIIFGLIFLSYIIIYNMNHFVYEGVEFEVVKFCDTKPCLIVYKTSLPITTESGQKADYNFFLRTDPRKLKDVPFKGELNMLPNMVINSQGNLTCGGDGVIAVANIVQLYDVIGTKTIRNESFHCNPSGSYIYLNIREANETLVDEVVQTCYNINVNRCEILPATERYMLETFIKLNKILSNSSS